jgi:signal transduction histidine kinase
MESIGQLAAGIAHEINTPTQFVGDNARFIQEALAELFPLLVKTGKWVAAASNTEGVEAELAKALQGEFEKVDLDYLCEEIPRALEQSIEGIDRISSIVKAMKEFSHPTMEMTAVDLNQAIESTVTVARNEWKYVAEVDLDLDRSLPAVPCLPGEINQVVLNMIVNAAHAIAEVVGESQEKGTIRIRTRLHGEWAEVQISDTGSGMPEEVRARVFDPFFTTKRVGQGTGQGLSIAHAVIVKKHGGVVSVESESGRGTTFRFLLPLVAQKAPAEEAHA